MTRRFELPSGRLFVNIDASGGEFQVEVESEDSKTLARSQMISHDATRQLLAWETGDIASLEGRRVALRFTFRNAEFYSYWFAEPAR